MINSLRVKNFGIIEDLQVDFSTGFNVLTGETGAGKSILIKALAALLGGKAGSELIRAGAERAEIAAVFSVNSSHLALRYLEELGIPFETQRTPHIIFRRVISIKGKAGTWVNDVHIAQHSAKELGQRLMDIFGQNDSFRMTSSQRHAELLDKFISEKTLLSFHQATSRVSQAIGGLKNILSHLKAMGSQIDYLKFRAEELSQFKPDAVEYENLKEKSNQIREEIRSSQMLASLSAYFSGSDENLGINQSIREVSRRLDKFQNQSWTEELSAKISELNDLASDISFVIESRISRSSTSEIEIEKLETRLHGYQDLMRKLSCSGISELIANYNEISNKLSSYQTSETQLAAALSEIIRMLGFWQSEAAKLSFARMEASQQLAKMIGKEFGDLSMKDARLEVKLEKKSNAHHAEFFQDLERFLNDETILSEAMDKLQSFHSEGLESVEFLLSANKGESLQPLEKVASGGEVSRIMLALKKVLSDGADACVLVFDEIDSGISGRVANMVGSKLKEMSSSFQILCISHLPQVAAYADKHFKVQKLVNHERTTSTIVDLDHSQSIAEIASMISGESLNEASLAHAKALKNEAKVLKKSASLQLS